MKTSTVVIGSLLLALGCQSKEPSKPAPTAAAPTPPVAAKAVAATPADTRAFGQPINGAEALPTVSITQVMADPGAYSGKQLRITGDVKQVCAKKGCWLTLGDADQAKGVFVKFTCPIDGRLIPSEAVGKPAVVQGTVKVTEMSEDQARHYKRDAGASAEEIAKIVGPQKRVIVASPAAEIAGLPAASAGTIPAE